MENQVEPVTGGRDGSDVTRFWFGGNFFAMTAFAEVCGRLGCVPHEDSYMKPCIILEYIIAYSLIRQIRKYYYFINNTDLLLWVDMRAWTM